MNSLEKRYHLASHRDEDKVLNMEGCLIIGMNHPKSGWEYSFSIIFNRIGKDHSAYCISNYSDSWLGLSKMGDILLVLANCKGLQSAGIKDFKPIIELLEKEGYTKMKSKINLTGDNASPTKANKFLNFFNKLFNI